MLTSSSTTSTRASGTFSWMGMAIPSISSTSRGNTLPSRCALPVSLMLRCPYTGQMNLGKALTDVAFAPVRVGLAVADAGLGVAKGGIDVAYRALGTAKDGGKP